MIMKTIMLHDYFKTMEGGGRLSLILAQRLGTDLGYGFKTRVHPYFDVYRLAGRQFDLGIIGDLAGWRNIALIHGFTHRTDFLKNYGAVVYSGFYAPMAIHNHPQGKNIYYCHTPPRYIYDQHDYYRLQYPVWSHPLIDALIAYHRPRYEAAVRRMDCVVTNSKNVKERIKTYLGLDASVVYPPCEIEKFKWIDQKDYYLSMARLDPLKRVHIIVDAFGNLPNHKLIVISDGPERKTIEKRAAGHDNITVMGPVSDAVYRQLIGNCIATVYLPKDEDFGMSPVESMAAGKPVIGVRSGGLLESIIDQETGMLIDPDPTVTDVMDAVKCMDRRTCKTMRTACLDRAAHFDGRLFISRMRNLLNGKESN